MPGVSYEWLVTGDLLSYKTFALCTKHEGHKVEVMDPWEQAGITLEKIMGLTSNQLTDSKDKQCCYLAETKTANIRKQFYVIIYFPCYFFISQLCVKYFRSVR